ncbi:SLC13 family permease [Kiloniella laminariae]|uniref:SLC13 family permease n=1 Tax=Kiloniella laminariae TaxID=454162 RepID=UPI00035E5494|nr:SLC13 family permease [Kiloniella laminariae]
MNTDQLIIFTIIGLALVLFIWGKIRYDVVAMMALIGAVIFGVVPADEAFLGFGHPAVITVAAVLIISHALQNSGIVELATKFLEPAAGRPVLHILALTTVVAICSAFMNNVGALALMLPIAIGSAYSSKRPTSEVLMPLSFGSLLGGLTTLIGTPPNIIISSFRQAETGQNFAMFDFLPVGLGVAVAGIAFISLVGWRFLPKRSAGGNDRQKLFQIEDYIADVRISENSPYVGHRLVDLETLAQGNVAVVALVRREDRMLAPSGYMRLKVDDILTLEADTDTLQKVVDEANLEIVGSAEDSSQDLQSDRVGIIEAVVTPGSRLEGRTAHNMQLHTHHGINTLGVARQGQPVHERIGRVRFMAGDVLLLQGIREEMPEALASLGLLPLAERELSLVRKKGSIITPLLFAFSILLVVFGILPPQISFLAAVGTMVLIGELNLKDLYESIDWSVIVLLAAMIPVGMALETTGGTMVIASPLIGLSDHLPVWAILALMMLITMMLSDVMNNAATAVLMAPIAILIANELGVNIDTFLIAVAIASSSTYLTPIGHQSNLLVMGPGGYKFGDYWRMGLPLDIIILLVSIPLILWVWPLQG